MIKIQVTLIRIIFLYLWSQVKREECGYNQLPVQQPPHTWDAEREGMKVKAMAEKEKEEYKIGRTGGWGYLRT